MKRILYILSATLVLSAWAEAPGLSGAVDELMESSGVHRQIAEVPAGIQAVLVEMAQQRADVTPAMLTDIQQAIADAFNANTMEQGIKSNIVERLEPEDLETVLEWLKSPLGRKITAGEESASSQDAVLEMGAAAQAWMQDTSRVRLIDRLDKAAFVTETQEKIVMNSQIAMQAAIANQITGKSPPMESLVAGSIKQLEQMRPLLRQSLHASLLYAYRELSNEELELYIKFAETPPAQSYHQVMGDAFGQEMEKASRKLGEALASQPPPP